MMQVRGDILFYDSEEYKKMDLVEKLKYQHQLYCSTYQENCETAKLLKAAIQEIKRLQPKKATWTLHKDGSATCSRCHFHQIGIWDLDDWQNYCGVCGAEMIGVNASVRIETDHHERVCRTILE